MSINTKMIALADEIREISGETGKLGVDAMTTKVSEANNEVGSQADLIAQVIEALQGKASGSGGEDVTEETETYTSLLANLETTINSLPEGGEFKEATGAITCNSTTDEGSVVATVTGLGFKPKAVFMHTTLLTHSGTISSQKITSLFYAESLGTTKTLRIDNSSGMYGGFATVTPTDDGFIVVKTLGASSFYDNNYNYYAYG